MKPNILFISCDQQRWDCLGFNGRYPVKTPNIDRLAEEGMRFNHSYTPLPTCCPARQALICGKRPESFGGLWNYDQGTPVGSLPKDAFSWARELHESGYHTGYVGKWHVSPTYTPLDYGYEDYFPEEEFHRIQAERNPDKHFQKTMAGWGFMGETSPYPVEDSPTHQNAAAVIELMDRYGEQPWHIKMDLSEPHLPCRPCEPFASMYEEVPKWETFDDPLENKPYIQKQMRYNWGVQDMTWDDCKDMVRRYYGYISQADDAIGKVIAHMEKTGILDNTLVIYTADHGDLCGDRGMIDKHYIMCDSVVRVPLVIRYPKMIRPGSSCDEMVTNMLDLVPTILEFAGLPVPEDLHAVSLMPYLKGQPHPNPRKYALTTYNGQQFGLYSHRMLRNQKWKFVWNLTDTDELYDMEKDPNELTNLAHDPSCAEIIRQFRLEMIRELDQVDDCLIRSIRLRNMLENNRKL